MAFVATACNRKSEALPLNSFSTCPQNGQLFGQRYTNEFFCFTIDVPTNWAVYDRAALEKGIHREYPKPERHYSPVTGWIEIPHIEIYNLITMSDAAETLTDGALTPTNAALAISAMYQVHFEDEGRPYDGRLAIAMMAGAMEITQRPDDGDSKDMQQTGPSEAAIGGRGFYRDTVRLTKGGVPLIRRFYARIDNEHSLVFSLLAPNDADLERLEQILATTRFH